VSRDHGGFGARLSHRFTLCRKLSQGRSAARISPPARLAKRRRTGQITVDLKEFPASMTASQPPKSVTLARYSRSLLDHDSLMTPILAQEFGALSVRKTQTDQASGHFLRRSSIFQIASGGKILDAELEISAAALPAKFLYQLLRDDVLFGQLLADFAIPVRLTDRVLYQTTPSPPETRWGRRLTIYHAETHAFICSVDEVLAPDTQLWPLRLKP
jgi:hypothetical protein